jgi:hypothetical protein
MKGEMRFSQQGYVDKDEKMILKNQKQVSNICTVFNCF